MYYHSKRMQGDELHYPPIENIVYAITHACRRFCAYFQAHPIKVLMTQPFYGMLHKPNLSGRLMR